MYVLKILMHYSELANLQVYVKYEQLTNFQKAAIT